MRAPDGRDIRVHRSRKVTLWRTAERETEVAMLLKGNRTNIPRHRVATFSCVRWTITTLLPWIVDRLAAAGHILVPQCLRTDAPVQTLLFFNFLGCCMRFKTRDLSPRLLLWWAIIQQGVEKWTGACHLISNGWVRSRIASTAYTARTVCDYPVHISNLYSTSALCQHPYSEERWFGRELRGNALRQRKSLRVVETTLTGKVLSYKSPGEPKAGNYIAWRPIHGTMPTVSVGRSQTSRGACAVCEWAMLATKRERHLAFDHLDPWSTSPSPKQSLLPRTRNYLLTLASTSVWPQRVHNWTEQIDRGFDNIELPCQRDNAWPAVSTWASYTKVIEFM